MESANLPIELTWLPSEDELPEIKSLLQLKSQKFNSQKSPIKALKTILSEHFNCSVQLCDFKQKVSFGASEKECFSMSTPITMFYAEYLFKVNCVIESAMNTNSNFDDIDKLKKIIKIFCSVRHKVNFPELWMNFNTSPFISNPLNTSDSFIDLQSFSLGNLFRLNKFVEHFSSESSLDPHNYKITQVKVKILHDAQILHLNFVVGDTKVKVKKRNLNSHRMHRLIIPYSLIHTILLSYDDNLTVYFRLYKSPLLFAVEKDEEAENYISYMDLKPNTKWIRTVELFNSCPSNVSKEFSMNYVLKLKFCQENYEVLKIVLYHKNVQLYFTPMSVIPYQKVHHPFQFTNFDTFFGAQCLLTHSYEILDHLMFKEEFVKLKTFLKEKCDENSKALSKTFHIIHSAISQCNIIMLSYSIKTLYNRLSVLDPAFDINGTVGNKKNNLLMIKRAIINPTHIRFIPPQPILQNRALRDCNPEFSLRISIRDVNLEPINFSFKAFNDEGKTQLKTFFEIYYKKPILKGIKLGPRRYEYVGSSTSQMRGHGLWFYAKDNEGKTAQVLRNHLGEIVKIKQVSKFMARMGQTFSQAMDYIIVPHDHTNINHPEKDIEGGVKKYLGDDDDDDNLKGNFKFLKPVSTNDEMNVEPYCFSDGIGRVSLEIADEVYKVLGVEEARPSAMQIRYAGCKGMLVVDPNLKGKIIFRESQKKFESKSTSLEILKLSEKRSASLNRPLITILEQLGVPKEIFIKLQKEMIQNHIKSMFHETDACNFLNRNSQLRFDFIGMHKVGIRFTEDPLFRSMIYGLFRKSLDLLKNKASIEIPVEKARAMFGVLDETFTLEYGQVFVQYSDWNTDEPKVLKGTVVVTKNPCMHPGDVRKFEAVDVEALHHIRDCIVFPAKGDRPHPDEMAGSDLDGDEYHVMWYEGFFFDKENVEAMNYATRKTDIKVLDRDITPEDEMDHLCDYIVNDNVGLIANAHLVFADRQSIFSKTCLRLAKKYAIALDFAKSGVPAIRDKKDKVFNYPDFMMKVDEKTTKTIYVSKKALGVLYRNCKCLEMGLETANNEVDYEIDKDLIYNNWESYEKSATNLYKKYCQKVEYLINIYSFNNEGELLAGAIINPPKYYEQRHDLESLKSLLEFEVQWLFHDFERQFFEEFSGKPVDGNYTEKMFQKASAWYAVTYKHKDDSKNNFYFGFPWAAADVLKRLKSNAHLHKGYKNFNQKSLLAMIVDQSVRNHLPDLTEDSEISLIHDKRYDVLDVACHILMKWLKTQREIFMTPNFKLYENIVKEEFKSVSSPLLHCEIPYIKNLKETNCIHHAISPFHYVLETMLCIANIKTPTIKESFVDLNQELGLLSWVTLIKLACTYNPQYLGIRGKDYNPKTQIFYVPQDNILSTFKVQLFDVATSNEEFSEQLLLNPEKVTKYLTDQTKLKNIDFRFDTEGDKNYVAIFTVMGSRYAIEKLKDLIVLENFFSWVVKNKEIYVSRP